MLNFTIGPVAMDEEIRKIGAEQIPYFRTPEFSELMLENETLMKRYMGAGEGARVLFLTGSGTASMEAAVMNLFDENDRLLVVNGGSFGQRFVDICEIHGIPAGGASGALRGTALYRFFSEPSRDLHRRPL